MNAQLLESGEQLTVYDTTNLIQTSELPNKNLRITCPDYQVTFDKNLVVTSIIAQIEELSNEGNLKDWQLKALEQIKRVRKFLDSEEPLYWTDFWDEGELIPIDEIEDDELLTKKLFWELVCPILDEGLFELTVNKEVQSQVLKTTSNINGATATVFVTEQGVAFWMCPPITVD